MDIRSLVRHARPMRFHLKAPWRADAFRETTPLMTIAGRGAMSKLSHPFGDVVVRPYRHGGIRRFILSQWFLPSERPAVEMARHLEAYEGGIPTVEPIGWAEMDSWFMGLRRYFFLTRFHSDLVPLTFHLRNGETRSRLSIQMTHILIRLRELSILHTDLNLNNWQMSGDKLLLIDFDKSKPFADNDHAYTVFCLSRIARSGLKLGLQSSHQRLFLIVLVRLCQALHLNPREMLMAVSRQMPSPFWREWRWKLSGGHR